MKSISFTKPEELTAADQRWAEFFSEARRLAALSRARRAAKSPAADTSAWEKESI